MRRERSFFFDCAFFFFNFFPFFFPRHFFPVKFPFFSPSFARPRASSSPFSRMAEETVVVPDVAAAVPSEAGAEGAETVVVIGE